MAEEERKEENKSVVEESINDEVEESTIIENTDTSDNSGNETASDSGNSSKEETPDSDEETVDSDEETVDSDEEEEDLDPDEKEDSVEIVDTFRPKKIKPILDQETIELLAKKKEHKLPNFKRQEWFRYKRLGDHWRKPRGLHSKMRINKGYRPPRVRVGYRTPAKVRSLHPSGFKDVLVYNCNDVDKIDPKTEAIRIGRTVGLRKRLDIVEKADSLNIRVLNRRGL